MAQHPIVDWSVTIMSEGGLVFESDIRAYVSVCGDGEVIIDNLDMWTRDTPRSSPRLVLMTASANHHMSALGMWAIEVLQADSDFIAKAQSEAGLVYVGLGGNDPDGHFKRSRAA